MGKENDVKVIDATGGEDTTFAIEDCPVLTQEETQDAADMVAALQSKYEISDEDMDLLFQGMVGVFVRGEYCKQMGFDPNEKDDN